MNTKFKMERAFSNISLLMSTIATMTFVYAVFYTHEYGKAVFQLFLVAVSLCLSIMINPDETEKKRDDAFYALMAIAAIATIVLSVAILVS